MNRFQQFICVVRGNIQDPDSIRPMTHHGLWHTYTAQTYQELLTVAFLPPTPIIKSIAFRGTSALTSPTFIWPPVFRSKWMIQT